MIEIIDGKHSIVRRADNYPVDRPVTGRIVAVCVSLAIGECLLDKPAVFIFVAQQQAGGRIGIRRDAEGQKVLRAVVFVAQDLAGRIRDACEPTEFVVSVNDGASTAVVDCCDAVGLSIAQT